MFGDQKNDNVKEEDYPWDGAVHFEKVLEKLGPSIRYQVTQIALTFLYTTACVLVAFNYIFIGYEPPHICASANETQLLTRHSLLNDSTAKFLYEKCQIRITSNQTGIPRDVTTTGCINGYEYEGGKDVSMKTEWDLVCDRRGVAELVQTMFVLGITVGSVIFTFLADRYGRKNIMVINALVRVIFEVVLTFSSSIYMVIGLRFLSGLVTITLIPYIIGAEILVLRHRNVYSMISLVNWASSIALLGVISWLYRYSSWRNLQLTTSLAGILPLLVFYFCDESIFCLFALGRYRDALKILEKACKINGACFDNVKAAFEECVQRSKKRPLGVNNKEVITTKGKIYSPFDIIRNGTLRVISMVLWLTYIACNMTYYGIYLTSSTLTGNRYLICIVLALVKIPGYLLLLGLIHYIGRRRLLVMASLAASAAFLLTSTCLVATTTNTIHVNKASTALFVLGKFSISICYGALFVFTPELYPTTLRSTGGGMCSCVSRIGEMIAPFFLPLFQIAPWAPGSVFTALCLLSLVFYPRIPETKGKELPISIEEIEAWKSGGKRDVNDENREPIVSGNGGFILNGSEIETNGNVGKMKTRVTP